MEEYINADPITFEHHKYFEYLQKQCLDWRLCDPYASLVSVSLLFSDHQFNARIWKKGKYTLSYDYVRYRLSIKGMVHSWSNVCIRWVLRSLWRKRLLSTLKIHGRSVGKMRKECHDRSNFISCQLCILCKSCPWQQVIS